MPIAIIVAVFLLTSTIVPAHFTYEHIAQNNENISITLTFSENDFIFKILNGYDVVYLKDGGVINEIGKPILPIKIIMVAIPENIKATNIKILDKTEKELFSTFDILPAQQPQKIGLTIENPTLIKDDNFYQSQEYYPSKIAQLNGMTDLAGQKIAIITIYPLQYNPYLKTLKLLTKINFVIEGETSYICGDYLPFYASETEKKEYQQKVKSMVVNPEDVVLKTNPDSQSLGIDPGDYDYVIITKSDWVSAFQPLSDCKTKKGWNDPARHNPTRAISSWSFSQQVSLPEVLSPPLSSGLPRLP